MSHKWEYEDEYLQLKSELRRARQVGNEILCQQFQARIQILDDMMWRSKTARFPELAPYQTVVEALEQTADRLGVPFPNLSDPRYSSGDGKFIFGVSDGMRSVQIWPMEDRGSYDVEVYEHGVCYKGQTMSLDEAALVLSRWFVERSSIDGLHSEFQKISNKPFQLSGPRVTFE
jgi:hypothetical protein